ncbi:membrane-associated protein, putative [Bodo saltans]|uniref:Membrane-associated protein, putative n=1 Tax=Bodo saltans TaxID=75058 RepID=A0A0S4IW84_BODSA|nr:membrane-associated protein, putative [Bodo saltans]|eukprot:CUG26316.1 membrane-associated protein, putative [Bodo saltans]
MHSTSARPRFCCGGGTVVVVPFVVVIRRWVICRSICKRLCPRSCIIVPSKHCCHSTSGVPRHRKISVHQWGWKRQRLRGSCIVYRPAHVLCVVPDYLRTIDV